MIEKIDLIAMEIHRDPISKRVEAEELYGYLESFPHKLPPRPPRVIYVSKV